MIRVAFCDDDISALNKMQGFLDQYCRERGREIAHTVFHSPVELLAEMERGGVNSLMSCFWISSCPVKTGSRLPQRFGTTTPTSRSSF